jgi:two-component system NarL family response regulator
MLTISDDDESLFEAVRNGASGYLLKNLETDELFSCLEQLAKGETVFSPGMADRLLQEFNRKAGKKSSSKTAGSLLSSRQEEILINIANGLCYKDVAVRLGIGSRTIKYHMAEILERLHLDNRAQAIAYISGATRGKR